GGRQREWGRGRRRRRADGAELNLGAVRSPRGYGSLEREAGAAQEEGSGIAEALEARLQIPRQLRRCRRRVTRLRTKGGGETAENDDDAEESRDRQRGSHPGNVTPRCKDRQRDAYPVAVGRFCGAGGGNTTRRPAGSLVRSKDVMAR